jgi:hypothetical protein
VDHEARVAHSWNVFDAVLGDVERPEVENISAFLGQRGNPLGLAEQEGVQADDLADAERRCAAYQILRQHIADEPAAARDDDRTALEAIELPDPGVNVGKVLLQDRISNIHPRSMRLQSLSPVRQSRDRAIAAVHAGDPLTQGALPVLQSCSRISRSRIVSIGCQKPA